jgi:hypothetical protein
MTNKKDLLRAIAERQDSRLAKARKIIREIKDECDRLKLAVATKSAIETLDKLALLQDDIWTNYDNEPEAKE